MNIQYSPASFFALSCVISPTYPGISTLLSTGAVSVPTDSIILSDSSVAVLGEVFRLSGAGLKGCRMQVVGAPSVSRPTAISRVKGKGLDRAKAWYCYSYISYINFF